MKRIKRPEIPPFFAEELAKKKPLNWETLSPEVKHRLCDFLIEVQEGLCGYTEISLQGKGRQEAHIDHFYKKGMPDYKKFTFDFSNLFGAFYHKHKEFGACFKDKEISSSKEYRNLIKPDEEDPTEHISFNVAGLAIPINNSEKGKSTIKIFNLNHETLVRRRKEMILEALSYAWQRDEFGQRIFSNEDILAMAREFPSAIKSVLPDP